MGEDKHIKELDAFTKKYIKDIELESPSKGFTVNIMETILESENSEIYKAVPLISKKMWFVLIGILITCILYVSRGTSLGWVKMPKVNLDFLSNIQIPNLFEGITVSNMMLSACFFFTIMFFGQIYMLKNHFTKDYKI
jgi:hypothetical protein